MARGIVGLGVVGAGSIGIRGVLNHLVLGDARERVRIAAICDPVPGRAKAAAAQYGALGFYERYEDLLADPAVEAVTLCSPVGLHYQQGLAAVRAGKHVHSNKPMFLTVAEADQLIAEAARNKVRLVASPGVMLQPFACRMRRLILEGKLGRLVWAVAGHWLATYHIDEPIRQGDDVLSNIDPTWYFKKPGGGPLYSVSVYSLHYLTGICGPARRVTAMSGVLIPEREFRGQKIRCEMDDNTLLLLDFGGSFFALGFATVAGVLTGGFIQAIYGTDGSIVDYHFGDQDLRQPSDHLPHVTPEHARLGESHIYEDIMQLADGVRQGKPTVASAEHARHVVEIMESAYRAAATGQAQELRTTFDPLELQEL